MPPAATNGIACNGFSALRVIVRTPRIACRVEQPALAVDDGDRAEMHALDAVAAVGDGERQRASAECARRR